MNMTAIGCFDGMDNFTADLRVLTKASLTSSSLSQQLPVDESASSAAKIDLRIEILALTAFDQSSLHDQKSEINSAIKNFFGSCRRFPNFREDFTPLVFFGGLGQLTFDSLEAKTSVKAFRYLPHVQERLSLIFDILGLDEASIDQLGNLLHDLRHLISLLVTTSRVDREALLALIHRAWLEVAGLKSVPSTDESKYNFRKSGLSGFVDDEVVALIDLFSVGMTEFVEANGTSSVPTQNGVQLDSLSVVMRRQMEASIKECQSAKTASIEPESAFDFSKLESYLQPVCTSLNLEVDRVIEMVFTVLKSDRQDETIQGELLDLMGLSQFDTVLDLIHGRTQWLLWYKKYRTRSDAFRGRGNGGRGSGYRKRRGANGSRFSGFGNSDDSKCDLVSQLINDPGALVEQRQRDLDSAACIARSAAYQAYVSVNSTNRRQGAERYPFVFDAMAELMAERPFTERSKMVLPSDAKQKHTDQWDSYDFPVPLTDRSELEALKKTLPREGRLVEISTLDRVGQLAFKGIQRLNLVQSIVFEAAYNSAENLLISAPTGAGKTNTALLAILHLIRQNINPETGVLDTNKFKIVYMAPMKALAAEMTATFGQRLAPLGLRVKECTGDMQLSTQEILETQMLVTTPEKWDVISRKGLGDASLVQALKLLIIDEIHLLHEDRGAVIEALVARTLRQVEVSQSVIRIVGLSATLPNYVDVAAFLRVNPQRGLFYFDARFRPVPLGMSFVGVKSPAGMPNSRHAQQMSMNEACYQRVIEQLRRNEQVMVFVHARGETLRTARWLLDTASQRGDLVHFEAPQLSNSAELKRRIARASDGALREIAPRGVACHHAGMLRPDRSLVERLFAEGAVRVLVCTATLAWGVNLPAHAVIIKGTCIYDPDRSDYVDLDILDVLQIFGRAGRPQFDKFGLATIITTHDKLDHYVRLITNQVPIESKFLRNLNDHLNAEIALGTVSNLNDAVTWLTYTYLFVRLTRSPMHYGITPPMLENDPDLTHFLTSAVRDAAKDLDDAKMVRFEQSTGLLASTDRGRTASLYYINYATASLVREELRPVMLVQDLISLVARANEFAQMKVRDDEEAELVSLRDESCRVAVKNPGTVEGTLTVKVNVLLQAHISRSRPVTHSLVSDMYYVQQNAGRLARYIFEIALRRNWATCASAAHRLSKMIEHRLWFSDTPLWQFIDSATDNCHLLERVDELKLTCERIRDLTLDELNGILRYQGLRGAEFVSRLASYLPVISLDVETQPVTRNILRITVRLTPNFTWVDRHHGAASPLLFWVWVEDPDESCIYHSEVFALSKKMVVNAKKENAAELIFTIPLHEPIPSQYLVRCMSDRFLGSEFVAPIPLRSLRLPHADPPHTDLLTLDPLPVGVLKNSRYEAIYPFTHFNPIQTQVFHTLYHQDVNVLLGAPTGSGKTAAAEFAIFRVFNTAPNKKCVYIAPLKALVRERVDDWNVRIWQKLGKRVVELTGDVSPDAGLLRSADLIVTTPEKWDGVSRSWRQRAYVQQIALIVIDEIHMVGEERGPILEVIVSRANFIANQLNTHIRIVGLSTALANAVDMAAWLRVPLSPLDVAAIGRGGGRGLFNFRPSVRPVPLEVHIQGFPGRHYCPRMALMNKPIFQAIQSHSASKPVLVFVASRRQTRRTAFDLISFASSDFDPHKWLHMDVKEMEALAATMSDANLQVTLPYGIGIHHAGLIDRDRRAVEELFVNQKIQVLIATSTLAWGVNFPAHLVIVKGTEYFDGHTKRYIDYPITDVLQMMGRAGRPQFDMEGKAVVMVQDTKKAFYKRFLYEPFPVESCLPKILPDYLNAEIAAGSVTSMQGALECLTWTFYYRRLLVNPNYYQLEEASPTSVNAFLSKVVSDAVTCLLDSGCVEADSEDPSLTLYSTSNGRLASFYYLSHRTISLFIDQIMPTSSIEDLLYILSMCEEFALMPVRHGEDEVNATLASQMPLRVRGAADSPHTKAHILLQSHLSRRTHQLPIADYATDTKSLLDQTPRIIQAMIDFSAEQGWLACTLRSILLGQMLTQATWLEDSPLLQLSPEINSSHLAAFRNPHANECVETLAELLELVDTAPHPYALLDVVADRLSPDLVKRISKMLPYLPRVSATLTLVGGPSNDEETTASRRPIPVVGLDVTPEESRRNPTDVYFDTDYALCVTIHHENPSMSRGQRQNREQQQRNPGWVVVLGELQSPSEGVLLALRKLPHRRTNSRTSTASLSFRFDSTERASAAGTTLQLTLYLMSDTYLSLDQQFAFCVRLAPAPCSSAEAENDI